MSVRMWGEARDEGCTSIVCGFAVGHKHRPHHAARGPCSVSRHSAWRILTAHSRNSCFLPRGLKQALCHVTFLHTCDHPSPLPETQQQQQQQQCRSPRSYLDFVHIHGKLQLLEDKHDVGSRERLSGRVH